MTSECLQRMRLAQVIPLACLSLSKQDFHLVSLITKRFKQCKSYYLVSLSDPPDAPRNLKANDVTKSSCNLTWDAPEFDGGSPITGYYVEKLSGTRWVKVTKKPISKCEFSINDLIEGSDCEFRVLAENKAGLSKPSDSTGRFKAKNPYEVPGRPESPEVCEMTADSAQLKWERPTSDGGSPITNYIIEMKSRKDLKWKKANKDTVTDTEFTVPGLNEGEEYEFRITAENKAGVGQPSKPSKSAQYGE